VPPCSLVDIYQHVREVTSHGIVFYTFLRGIAKFNFAVQKVTSLIPHFTWRLARNYWISTYRAGTRFKLWHTTNNMKIISTILSLRIFSCWSEQTRQREKAGVQLGELSSNQRTRTRVFPTLHHSPTSISLHVRHLSLHNPLSAPCVCLCSLIKVIEWKQRSLTCVRWICFHVKLLCMLVTLITQVSWPHHGISFLCIILNYNSFTEILRCLRSGTHSEWGGGCRATAPQTPQNEIKKKHRFCRYYEIRRFTWFTPQLKSATGVGWLVVRILKNKLIKLKKTRRYDTVTEWRNM
jgi:hypothetical protein